jgi:hypothetical protein
LPSDSAIPCNHVSPAGVRIGPIFGKRKEAMHALLPGRQFLIHFRPWWNASAVLPESPGRVLPCWYGFGNTVACRWMIFSLFRALI